MVSEGIWILAVFIMLERLIELVIARRNQMLALAAGAKEYGAKHYPLFFLLHSGWLLGWIVEGHIRGRLSELWYLWFGAYLLAQGLRYWCITSLGTHWNTRILVIPNGKNIRHGPYRYLKHPNYLAVAIELISVPMIFEAVITALFATLANAFLLLRIRIPTEEKALKLLK
ncbi:MAG TPA: isoprenylcysteine carboxylmethyltransferase family protein [Methylomusa anaerophila]|uniref:Isoprenylcysteine carboxyl methyltransferase (ICMT) family protein n=1 Tax=Methylomusa anaerophila TaxID=1930071 RepID=A0A348AM21_9FIRM|nr:isoprenylcysteine carboxylmethyltransferase family protein [Methylomusa anaerophila]BBB92119.1 isoprenylcysteine carboxyl methyltransferase (ICMT) family protein [Methylomusa anaerophila]HML87867.1 isoprenylcysteine carboxylmethyltransferase family protein [Methylomusa anaerophila]